MFPLLARMIRGLYYNMPLVSDYDSIFILLASRGGKNILISGTKRVSKNISARITSKSAYF